MERQREGICGLVTWLAGEALESGPEEHVPDSSVPDRKWAGMGEVSDLPLLLYLQLSPDTC